MYRPELVLSVLLAAFSTLIFAQNTIACSCSYLTKRATAAIGYEKAETVITTTLLLVSDPDTWPDEQSIKMRVEKVYKGKVKVGDILNFGQAGGKDCLWFFTKEKVGMPYLFYLDKPTKARPYKTTEEIEKSDAEPKYYVSTCGRSAPIEEAASDVSYLEGALFRRDK